MIDALALTLLLGAFCARFRDIQPIVNSVMQIGFFMTPVIWKPDQLGAAGIAKLPLNPFFDLLEIVRGPILGSRRHCHDMGGRDRLQRGIMRRFPGHFSSAPAAG